MLICLIISFLFSVEMKKLTTLIFTKDDISKTLDLIKDIYAISDEIVVIDSSMKTNRKKLLDSKRRMKLNKLKIFYAVALGYPDPLRTYALNKCSNEWVFLIDTDERLSSGLKSEVKSIVNKTKASAFAIRRYEDSKMHSFTWQIRLFRKSRTVYRGLLHEQPIVNGILMRIQEKELYLKHSADLRGGTNIEYSKMEDFDRLSYEIANQKFLEYMSKFLIPKEPNLDKTLTGKFVKGAIKTYQKIKLKSDSEELSNFDYFMFYASRDFGDRLQQNDMLHYPHQLKARYTITLKRVRALKSRPDSKVEFEISKRINDIGIIKYLQLDKESTIQKLNSQYGEGEQGINLLIKLLKNRYYQENGANE